MYKMLLASDIHKKELLQHFQPIIVPVNETKFESDLYPCRNMSILRKPTDF